VVPGALPGSVHDKKAEWICGVMVELEKAGLVTLADEGHRGARTRRSRTRGRSSRNPRRRPTGPTGGFGDQRKANAQLKAWRIHRKLRCCSWRAGKLAKAIYVLQLCQA
jgi:hypothetical protein